MGARAWLFSLLFVFLVFGIGTPEVMAREVLVEEVSISLYNRPVTGYRVLLDRNPKVVKEQVLAHINSQEDSPPFKFEQTLIYENIRYLPISEARDLSLYYVIQNLEAHFTELTLVVMYDFRQSVNSRDFPALSLKVQADMARLVRRTTGDILRSERLVFDDNTLSNIKKSFTSLDAPGDPKVGSERNTGGELSDLVEHFQEEEVENEGVLLKGDLFAEGNASKIESSAVELSQSEDQIPEDGLRSVRSEGTNPEIQRLKARIIELELSESQLRNRIAVLEGDQVVMERRKELLENKLAESREVWDSVAVLNRRVEEMMGHYYLADDFSVSNETALQMQELERNARRNEDQLRILGLENDSLQSRNLELQDLLSKTGSSVRERAQEIRRLQKESKSLLKNNKILQEDLRIASARMAGNGSTAVDSLLEVVRKQGISLQNAESNVKGAELREKELRSNLKANRDQVTRMEEKIAEIEAVNQSLTQENNNLLSTLAENRPSPNPAPVPDKNLQDSLDLLKNRVKQLEARQSGNASASAQIEKLDRELNLSAQKIRQLNSSIEAEKGKLSAAEKRNLDLKQNLVSAQKATKAAESRLNKAIQEQKLGSQERNQLEAELAVSEKSLEIALQQEKALQDSLFAAGELKNQLLQRIRRTEVKLRRETAASDSLEQLLGSTQRERNQYRSEIGVLQSKVDSLEAVTIPDDDQGNFIREQWAKLQAWEKDLNSRDASIQNKEKLIQQREKFIVESDANLETREERLKGLEAREKELQTLEQKLKASNQMVSANNDPGSFKVRDGRIMEFGDMVQVFIVDTDLGYQAAQRRMVAYMLSRNELLNEQFPDLVFAGATFPELSGDPIDIRIRIDTRGASGSTIQVSFKTSDGIYIGSNNDRNQTEVARQLVARMIRFKF